MRTSSTVRGVLVVAGMAAVLFHPAAMIQAQPDSKDAIIKMLQEKIGHQQKDIVLLKKEVRDQEATIIKLRALIIEFRKEAVRSESIRRMGPLTNEQLPNPPSVKVDGKIEKIDDGLVLISVGTEDGVKKDQTLDVFRLQPEPRYVGVIRVVDANFSKSVARVIYGDAARFTVGDLVTSKLTKEEPKKK